MEWGAIKFPVLVCGKANRCWVNVGSYGWEGIKLASWLTRRIDGCYGPGQ